MLQMKCKMLALFLVISCITVSQVVSIPLVKDGDSPNYRLDGNIRPIAYDINIATNQIPNTNDFDYFQGIVTITASVTSDIERFNIHVGSNIKELEEEKFKVTANSPSSNKPVNITKDAYYDSTPEYDGNDLYNVEVSLKENDIITIEIEYNAIFPDGMYGFYKSYYTEEGEERVLLTTQFQPTHARKAFPCFDEPAYKATFKLTLKVPEKYKALSNSKLITLDREETSGMQTFIFEDTPKMSTYLLAFMVFDEETYTSEDNNDKTFNTWGRKSEIEEENAGSLSQHYGPMILDAMERETGIKYNLEDLEEDIINRPTKIDQAAIPDFSAGAMENWGLVTYRETALLFKEGKHSETAKKRVIEIIAHELAHQWYGNLITTQWWDSTWLNEGFATYYEYMLTDEVTEGWRMDERFIIDEQMRALVADASDNASPLTSAVESPSSVTSHFSTITYSKGGSILRMFENIIGKQRFKNNLKTYLKENAGKAVNPEELFQKLADGVTTEDTGLTDDDNLVEIFERWTEEKGFPLVHVGRSTTSPNNIRITQSRFLLEGESDKKYDVKLNLISNQDGLEGTRWLKNGDNYAELSTLESGKWVLVKTSGYFRVNYDDDIWQALLHQIHSQGETTEELIEPIERAVLVDNALSLARINKTDYDLAIDILSYLEHELDFIPWYAASTGLNFLHRMLVNSEKDNSNKINNFILLIIDHVYHDIGQSELKTHIEKVHYANIFNWACRAGHEDCLEKVKDHFPNYIGGDNDDLNVDVMNTVYCYAVKNNDTAWLVLWDELLQEQDATIRSVLISALGCTPNRLALHMYLESAVSGQHIRAQDAASVFSSVYSNPGGTDVCLEFLERRLSAVADTTSTVMNAMTNIINGMASYLTKEEEKVRLLALADLPDITPALKETIKTAGGTVETNIKWKEQFEDEVLKALEKQLNNGGMWAAKPLTFLTITIAIAVSLM